MYYARRQAKYYKVVSVGKINATKHVGKINATIHVLLVITIYNRSQGITVITFDARVKLVTV